MAQFNQMPGGPPPRVFAVGCHNGYARRRVRQQIHHRQTLLGQLLHTAFFQRGRVPKD